MTFEEDFPSLKHLPVSNNVMNRKEIQVHCLDKQRLLKGLKDWFKAITENDSTTGKHMDNLRDGIIGTLERTIQRIEKGGSYEEMWRKE